MELIVDLHIHSHFSRATSRDCTFAGLYRWAKIKGISIIGTGDFTHPQWFAEMRQSLEPAEAGLYKLKDELAHEIDQSLPLSVRDNLIRFIPTVEIATIYKKGGKVRKLHQLVVMPDFKAVSELNARLERIGNLKADGRPILGLDSKELLRHVLEVNERALYIPAHIWTPWFGMFGSKSGFDSIAEAYDELKSHITTIETGLSSDPAMNWRLPDLDGRTIMSNSDAHSPGKLGREASVLDCGLAYDDIVGALKTNDHRFAGTIEFFPQEGKYHQDGHRHCGVRFAPHQTKAAGGLCPECEKPLTVGVEYRVNELAQRPADFTPKDAKKVEHIIPLPEILAELNNVRNILSKAVVESYHKIIQAFGNEFAVLRTVPLEAITGAGLAELAIAIERLRNRDVILEPGYDGLYGTIKVFKNNDEKAQTLNQLSLVRPA